MEAGRLTVAAADVDNIVYKDENLVIYIIFPVFSHTLCQLILHETCKRVLLLYHILREA